MKSNVACTRVAKLWLILALFLFITPIQAQGPIIYLPFILKGNPMTYKSTLGIVSPYGVKNHVLNPSAEIAGNFSNQGSGTTTRGTVFQKYGIYSYELTAAASGDGINLTLLALENSPHYVTFRVNTQHLNLRFNITLGSKTIEARFLERIDDDWSLLGATFPDTVSNGQTSVRISHLTIPSVSMTIFIDGVQVEPTATGAYSTYIDGTQEGCRWTGTAHASASTRSGDSRAGGIVKDFWLGYGFVVEKVLGAGSVVENLNIDSFAFLPGGELNSSKIQPREFTIIGYFLGDTREELHAKVQSLELELDLNTYPGRQPVRIRYSGAVVQKEIAARYAGGLEGELPIFYNDKFSHEGEDTWTQNFKFRMKASIQFLAEDPFWYEVGESAVELDTNDETTFETIAGRLLDTGQWDNLGPPDAGGTYNAVYAIAEDDTYIYIGGDFDNFDGIAAADNIVRYNKQTGAYSAMASLSDIVRTIIIAPNGDVIVGGFFTNASGVAEADYIAVWAVGASAFTALGTPVSGGAAITSVEDLLFDPTGTLWIVGEFLNWANIANADHIVTWDGSAYAAPSTGANGLLSSLAYYGGKVYIGGNMSSIGGVSVTNVAAWNIADADYEAVGDNLGGSLHDMVIAANGSPIIATSFAAGGYVLIFENGNWYPLGGVGTNGTGYRLAVGPDNMIYLSGGFTQAGDITVADRIAKFNGYSFSHLDIDLPGTPFVQALLVSKIDVDPVVPQNYSLYLGFTTTGTGAYAGLASAQNEGTISAFPKIVFYRSGGDGATIQTLRNERTGRELLFNYSLLDGETLTIDLNPKNRTIVSSFFGPRMDARLANDDFSVWQLLPGENSISSFVSEDGSPTVVGYLLYREAYKSWN